MNREQMNYLTAKDLPNFVGSEIWVQKKPTMISRGAEIEVFGKLFLELVLLDVDFKRNQLVLQGHDGRVEVIPLSQCALILACARKMDRATGDEEEEILSRGRVDLNQ